MGCQGFIGPIPSAFLDKYAKELVQIYRHSYQISKLLPHYQMLALPEILCLQGF
jgi:hypothetical protein